MSNQSSETVRSSQPQPPPAPQEQQQNSESTTAKRWHFELHPSVEYLPHTLTSVFSDVIHPTHAVLAHSDGAEREWRSRSHRKHRYRPLGITNPTGAKKLLNMFKIEYWNISWWVAWVRDFPKKKSSQHNPFFQSSILVIHDRKRGLGHQRICQFPPPE
jgi:hypothetical protein